MLSTGASYALAHVQQKRIEEKLQEEKESGKKDGANAGEGKNVRDDDDKSKVMVPIYGFETLMVMSRSCSSNASRINPIL
ncbi:hypothetical protein AgCh_008566 [Apium graveolens]